MKRPEQHEIDTAARRLLQSVLPPNLVVREQSDDYGIDAEVELFEEGHSTGVIFKVQLKGTKNPTYSTDGDFLSFSLEVYRAEYLIEQVKIPTAIILCDIVQGLVFWTVVHTNQKFLGAYEKAKANNQGTFTFHFRTQDQLPHTLSSMLLALSKAGDFMALNRAADIQPPVYSEHIQNLKNIDSEILHLREKIDISNAEKLYRLIKIRATSEAYNLIQQVLKDDQVSAEAKFHAMLHMEQVYIQRIGTDTGKIGGYEKAAFDLWQANQLSDLAKKTTPSLKRLAEGYLLAAQISDLVTRDFNLFLNWKMQQSAQALEGEPLESFWFAMLPFVRTKYARELLDKIDEASKLISAIVDEQHWQILPKVITRLLGQIIFFVRRLKLEGLEELASNIENWIDGVLGLACSVAEKMLDSREADENLYGCALIHLFLMDSNVDTDKQYQYEQAMKMQQAIKDKDIQKECLTTIEEAVSRFKTTPKWDENNPDWESIENFYRHQAAVLGIDLSLVEKAETSSPSAAQENNIDARIAWMINVGLQDLNPTRALKNCRHMVLEYWGGVGMPALTMGLHTARRKRFGCVKHPEFGMIGGSLLLGDAYRSFYERCCTTCTDLEPHPEGWGYTEPWHKDQIERFEEARKRAKNKS
jgi:hypothetical protein